MTRFTHLTRDGRLKTSATLCHVVEMLQEMSSECLVPVVDYKLGYLVEFNHMLDEGFNYRAACKVPAEWNEVSILEQPMNYNKGDGITFGAWQTDDEIHRTDIVWNGTWL